jgi:hypothetical protein
MIRKRLSVGRTKKRTYRIAGFSLVLAELAHVLSIVWYFVDVKDLR